MIRTRLSDSELAALAARIQQNYDYDDRSGKLVNAKTNRVVRGEKHCKRNGKHRYLLMRAYINGQRHHILMHRVVWAWHHGRLPTMQIDHINGNGFDNRIENLREVTQSENLRNQHRQWKPNAKTGLPGVSKCSRGFLVSNSGKRYFYHDKDVAFYHLTLLGRRFK